jgi:hypothetical protein
MLENTEKPMKGSKLVSKQTKFCLKKKTGYIQTDEGGVNEQYKSNKNKRWELMRLIFMDG